MIKYCYIFIEKFKLFVFLYFLNNYHRLKISIKNKKSKNTYNKISI